MILKKFKGFEFVKVATFDVSENPYTFTNNKKVITWHTPTRVNFINQSFIEAECSTYLVIAGTEYREKDILYVGVYTNNLKKRWLRLNKSDGNKEWITWHGDRIDNGLNEILKRPKGKPNEISLWLTVNPYLSSDIGPINISCSIEQLFLQSSVTELPLKFNQHGRSQPDTQKVKTVRKLLDSINLTS